jgi:hypothetical protein
VYNANVRLRIGDVIYARIDANDGVGSFIHALGVMAVDRPAGSFVDENI